MDDGEHQEAAAQLSTQPVQTVKVAQVRTSNGSKRKVCDRCHLPSPRGCVCEGLPDEPIVLKSSRVLVLEHPLEVKRKNRSVPLLRLCLTKDSVVVGRDRRFESSLPQGLLQALHDDSHPCLLLFPGPGAVSLNRAMELVREHYQERTVPNNPSQVGNDPTRSNPTKSIPQLDGKDEGAPNGCSPVARKINVVVLDATWGYAAEMDKANTRRGLYPNHMIRVELGEDQATPDGYKPCRYAIRRPPKPGYLSTAECVAWVLSVIEEDPSLYSVLVRPLDVQTMRWQSCAEQKKRQRFEQQQQQRPSHEHQSKRQRVGNGKTDCKEG